jgi:sulfite exporter TauE/SafE
MEGSLLTVLSIGFVVGIKHALEPDHVIAVSTIASHAKKLSKASLAGIFWGSGHTLTLLVAGMLLIMMKGAIPDKWAMSLEFVVGIMLVYLGVSSILSFRKQKIQLHQHSHGGYSHRHLHQADGPGESTQDHDGRTSFAKSAVIGMVHGLAGSAAMVLLTMSTVQTEWEGLLYILVFGAGTIVGMLLCTTVIGIPFVLSAKNVSLNTALTRLAGIISVAFGCYYMYNLGVTEGLFQMWLQAGS